MGDRGEPCGLPLCMVKTSEMKLPILRDTVRSVRKERTQSHTCEGKPFSLRMLVIHGLDDPGALAEVARLRMLSMCIPVYTELMQAVQDLSSAMHKFHKQFNDKARQLVLQLKATKKRMEGAQICFHIQNILLKLTHPQELRERFYWPGIPSLLKHPNQYYILSLCDTHTVTVEGLATAKAVLENGKENKDKV